MFVFYVKVHVHFVCFLRVESCIFFLYVFLRAEIWISFCMFSTCRYLIWSTWPEKSKVKSKTETHRPSSSKLSVFSAGTGKNATTWKQRAKMLRFFWPRSRLNMSKTTTTWTTASWSTSKKFKQSSCENTMTQRCNPWTWRHCRQNRKVIFGRTYYAQRHSWSSSRKTGRHRRFYLIFVLHVFFL